MGLKQEKKCFELQKTIGRNHSVNERIAKLVRPIFNMNDPVSRKINERSSTGKATSYATGSQIIGGSCKNIG